MLMSEIELIKKETKNNLELLTCDNKENLIDCLDENNFWECPASLKHHESYDGGLMVHEHRLFTKFWEKMDFYKLMSRESAFKVSLGHDLCKMLEYIRNDRHVWIRNQNAPIGHGALSVAILTDCGIHLTEEEENIIRYHMGVFNTYETVQQNGWGFAEYNWDDVRKAILKHPTVQIFAATDLEVSRWIEVNRIEDLPEPKQTPEKIEVKSIPDTTKPKSIEKDFVPKINFGR